MSKRCQERSIMKGLQSKNAVKSYRRLWKWAKQLQSEEKWHMCSRLQRKKQTNKQNIMTPLWDLATRKDYIIMHLNSILHLNNIMQGNRKNQMQLDKSMLFIQVCGVQVMWNRHQKILALWTGKWMSYRKDSKICL